MPLDFLRKIQDATFPLRVEDPREVNCVVVLIAAKMVEGTLSAPAAGDTTKAEPELAGVDRITALGRAELARKGGGLRSD